MANVSTLAVDTLHDAFKPVPGGKAAKWLEIGLAYEDDVSVEPLRGRYDISL
jgi:hypothetical protein